MLSPGELKKRQFSRSLRGYSVSEVDEHMSFILEKYTEIYQRNDELEKELARLQAEYERLLANEDAIRRAMVNAQREERKIIDEANDRASLILRTAKLNTDRMLSEFKAKIREERVTLHKLRRAVAEFKENSLKQYQLHLEFLNQISPDMGLDDPELEMTEDDYANSLLEQMKLDIESGKIIGEEAEEPEQSRAPRRTSAEKDETAKKAKAEDPKAKTAVFDKVKKRGAELPDSDTKEIKLPKKK
jgi:cell division initiation protein